MTTDTRPHAERPGRPAAGDWVQRPLWPRRAGLLRNLSASAHAVYDALLDRARWEGERYLATASQTHNAGATEPNSLASDTGYAERAVRLALAELRNAGLIAVVRRGNSAGIASTYQIIMHRVPATGCRYNHDTNRQTSDTVPANQRPRTGKPATPYRQQIADLSEIQKKETRRGGADSHNPDTRTPADSFMRAMGISANRRAELAQVHPADILAAWSKYSTDATIRYPASMAAKQLAEGMAAPNLTAGDIIRAIERGYVTHLAGRPIARDARLTHNAAGLFIAGKLAILAGELRETLAASPNPDAPPWGAADASAAPATPEATDRPKAASEATNAPEGKPAPAPGNVAELVNALTDSITAPRERPRTAHDLRRKLPATEPPPRQRQTLKPAEPAKPLSAEELEARREAMRQQAASLKESA